MSAVHWALIVRCPDRKGIVAAVASFLAGNDASITESSHFNDSLGDQFFMRTVFRADGPAFPSAETLKHDFAAIADRFQMVWELHDLSRPPRVVIAVSRFGHCLTDLLNRWRAGQLNAEIAAVVSNHEDMRSFVDWSGVPYHYLPVATGKREIQEARMAAVIEDSNADLIVLARYMQILSPDMCALLEGRCINIHHSFLPSFKGAKPYHQAHERGVKIIGATAHYVTTDLDEGPIIEQGVQRVDHGRTPAELAAIGRDIECSVLARAVMWHLERRIILNGKRTVVFA